MTKSKDEKSDSDRSSKNGDISKKWQKLRPLIKGGRWLHIEPGTAARQRHIPAASKISQSKIKILTFNIQAGLNATTFSDYFKSSVSQFLPSPPNLNHVSAIGDLIQSYDLIALQELDGGSHRSGHLNQLSYFAQHGTFEFWHQQLNRDLGRFGQFSNGLLSRFTPFHVEDHRLPGLPGRGAIFARYYSDVGTITVCCVHLALSEKARYKQLGYIRDILKDEANIILMGDMNCLGENLEKTPIVDLNLSTLHTKSPTFPSWEPVKNIDHILVSNGLKVCDAQVIDSRLSDHCPVALTLEINPGCAYR